MDYLAAWMFLALTILLLAGFPVTFTLLGVSLTFGMIGFGWDFFNLLPLRIWGVMTNFTLLAVPLFVFMGVMLERSGLAEELLDTMGLLFGRIRGGLAVSNFRDKSTRTRFSFSSASSLLGLSLRTFSGALGLDETTADLIIITIGLGLAPVVIITWMIAPKRNG